MLHVATAGASTLASGEGLSELLPTAALWLAVSLLCALLYWVLALFIARRRGGVERGTLLAALVLAAVGGSALYLEAHIFAVREPLLSASVQLLFVLFFFPRASDRYVSKRARWLVVLFVIAQIGVFSPQQTSSQQDAQYVTHLPELVFGAFTVLGYVFAVIGIVIAIVPQLYARSRRRAVEGTGAASINTAGSAGWARWAMLLGASFVVLLVAALLAPLPATPSPLYLAMRTVYFLLASLLPVAAAFMLARGRPYDRDALANRALIYIALAIGLLAIYGACIAVLALLFPGFGALSSGLYVPFLIVIGLLMLAAYRPLRALIQERVERRFFRRRYEAERALAAFESTMREDAHLDGLSDGLVAALQKAFHPASVTLWLRATAPAQAKRPPSLVTWVPGGARAGVALPVPPPPPAGELRLNRQATTGDEVAPTARSALAVAPDDPLHSLLLSGSHALMVKELPELAASLAASALQASGATVAVPLLARGELVGVMGSGMPTSGPDYTTDERELLAMLAERIAPALDVAQAEHEQEEAEREREQAEQELQTARRIQEALLPKVVPQLAGWQIAALYQPARAVGGDFYDFIELRDGRLGLVLGDVTDKGIPAALVMATTRSMLRAVAVQHGASPGGVLAQVNELLCADLPASMFVTCFYAILDSTSGRLRFANAGQDLPYCRRAGGEVGELRATGMPLGLMPDMRYEEQETTLAAGESVLFYSDGLVEAHSPRREMFGFPRLSALLASGSDAAPPIVTLLSELAAFTGPDWEQEDDITLVTLRRGDDDGAPLAARSS